MKFSNLLFVIAVFATEAKARSLAALIDKQQHYLTNKGTNLTPDQQAQFAATLAHGQAKIARLKADGQWTQQRRQNFFNAAHVRGQNIRSATGN